MKKFASLFLAIFFCSMSMTAFAAATGSANTTTPADFHVGLMSASLGLISGVGFAWMSLGIAIADMKLVRWMPC